MGFCAQGSRCVIRAATHGAEGQTEQAEFPQMHRLMTTDLTTLDEPRELSLLSESLRLLAEAKTIDEVKNIRDKAEALRMYVKQQGESLEIQNVAAEIKIRAERRAGWLLAEMPKNVGAATRLHDATTPSPPSLEDLGIDKFQSHRWQKIATVPEDDFESHIEQVKADAKELTSAGVLRLAQKDRPKEPDIWSIHEAMDRLRSRVRILSLLWPPEHLSAMAHQLQNLGKELLDKGELCE